METLYPAGVVNLYTTISEFEIFRHLRVPTTHIEGISSKLMVQTLRRDKRHLNEHMSL